MCLTVVIETRWSHWQLGGPRGRAGWQCNEARQTGRGRGLRAVVLTCAPWMEEGRSSFWRASATRHRSCKFRLVEIEEFHLTRFSKRDAAEPCIDLASARHGLWGKLFAMQIEAGPGEGVEDGFHAFIPAGGASPRGDPQHGTRGRLSYGWSGADALGTCGDYSPTKKGNDPLDMLRQETLVRLAKHHPVVDFFHGPGRLA